MALGAAVRTAAAAVGGGPRLRRTGIVSPAEFALLADHCRLRPSHNYGECNGSGARRRRSIASRGMPRGRLACTVTRRETLLRYSVGGWPHRRRTFAFMFAY
jgi:hypothetical protein